MDAFMSTYEENLKKEQEKIEQLEKDIVFALEHSSSNIDLDLSEIDSLKQKEGYTSAYDDSKKSIETLTKEYERFQANLKKVYLIVYILTVRFFQAYSVVGFGKKCNLPISLILNQVESTRERLATELQTLPEKTQAMTDELVTLSDLEKLREEGKLFCNAESTGIHDITTKIIYYPTENLGRYVDWGSKYLGTFITCLKNRCKKTNQC